MYSLISMILPEIRLTILLNQFSKLLVKILQIPYATPVFVFL